MPNRIIVIYSGTDEIDEYLNVVNNFFGSQPSLGPADCEIVLQVEPSQESPQLNFKMPDIKSFYFGEAPELLGIWQVPSKPKNHTVVVCSPLLQESARAHWVLRRIANELVAKGYHVLRFDFAGCGNSKGVPSECRAESWRENVRSAIEELSNLTDNLTQLSIFAGRYAASIVAPVTFESPITNLVLWDPVLTGMEWLKDLRAVTHMFATTAPRSTLGNCELAGHDLGRDLLLDLENPSVSGFEGFNATNVCAIQGSMYASISSLTDLGVETETSTDVYSWVASDLQMMYLHDIVDRVSAKF